MWIVQTSICNEIQDNKEKYSAAENNNERSHSLCCIVREKKIINLGTKAEKTEERELYTEHGRLKLHNCLTRILSSNSTNTWVECCLA